MDYRRMEVSDGSVSAVDRRFRHGIVHGDRNSLEFGFLRPYRSLFYPEFEQRKFCFGERAIGGHDQALLLDRGGLCHQIIGPEGAVRHGTRSDVPEERIPIADSESSFGRIPLVARFAPGLEQGCNITYEVY